MQGPIIGTTGKQANSVHSSQPQRNNINQLNNRNVNQSSLVKIDKLRNFKAEKTSKQKNQEQTSPLVLPLNEFEAYSNYQTQFKLPVKGKQSKLATTAIQSVNDVRMSYNQNNNQNKHMEMWEDPNMYSNAAFLNN